MNGKKKVLIFPAGTEIGLELHNSLKYSTHFEIYGGTSSRDHSYFIYKDLFENIPYVNDEHFIEAINRICLENHIDFIYPAHDSVNLTLSVNSDKLCAKIVTSPCKTVEICRDKKETYSYFSGKSYIPKTFNSIDDINEYPVFIKPRVGQGSVGAKRIDTRQQLTAAINECENAVICEFLSGSEYTVDCFSDKNGKLLCAMQRERIRVKNGISVCSNNSEEDKAVTSIAHDINSMLDFRGAWFFQLRLDKNGEYKLLEISPRIPGTVGLSRNRGVNFALLSLFVAAGENVDVFSNNYSIALDRALFSRYNIGINYDTVYVDLDDTLIIKDYGVNQLLIMFLYQCVNKHKKIILLSKHAEMIENTLSYYKISLSLFDEIIRINLHDVKSEYVKSKNAIFIDDSFSERKEIHISCKIPVFDTCNIEALIDWKM